MRPATGLPPALDFRRRPQSVWQRGKFAVLCAATGGHRILFANWKNRPDSLLDESIEANVITTVSLSDVQGES